MAGRKKKDNPAQTDQKPDALVVLGMHRSGTSALTRLLAMTGAALPRHVLGSGAGNEAGHWEPEKLTFYHDQLLGELNSSWHDWKPLNLKAFPTDRRNLIRADLIELIEQEFPKDKPIVIKEPRTCRFAKFFLKAVEEAGYTPRVIIAFRNPLEVIDSLITRSTLWPEHCDRTDAALLWLIHVLEAERASRDHPRAFSSYERLLDQPETVLDEILTTIEYEPPHSVESLTSDIGDFLQPSLKHQFRKLDEVFYDPQLSGWIGGAYNALRDLEAERGTRKAMAALDRIHEEFLNTLPLLEASLTSRHQMKAEKDAAVRSAAEAVDQTEQLRNELHAAQAGADEKQAHIHTLEARLSEAVSGAERQQNEFNAAIASAKEKEASIRTLEGQLIQSRAERDELTDKITFLKQTLAGQKEEKEDIATKLETAHASAEEKQASVENLKARLTQSQAERDDLLDQITFLEQVLASQKEEKEDIATKLETAHVSAEEKEASIRTLEGRLTQSRAERDDLMEQITLLEQTLAGQKKELAGHKEEKESIAVKLATVEKGLLEEIVDLKRTIVEQDQAREKTEIEITRLRKSFESERQALETERNEHRDHTVALQKQLQTHAALLSANRAAFRKKGTISKVVRSITGKMDVRAHGKLQEQKRLIEKSELFDRTWYLEQHPDVANNGIDPAIHYLTAGYLEGRNPSPDFDGNYYLATYPDVNQAGWNPLIHYLRYGVAEDRKISLQSEETQTQT